MKGCEEDKFIFLTPVSDEFTSVGICCLHNDLLKIKTEKLLTSKNILKTLKVSMDLLKQTPYFVKGNKTCRNNEKCEWKNFEIENVKINDHHCNLKCEMCDAYTGYKNKDVYFKLLEKVKGYNLKKLYLTTYGEPFFFKEETFKLLESLTKNDFEEVYIITNGTLIDEEDIKRLSALNVKIKVIISIDGITKETYDKIRIGGDFEKAKNNAILLNKYGLLLNISVVIQPLNLKEIPLMEDFWNNYGIKVSFIFDRRFDYQLDKTKTELIDMLLSNKETKEFYLSHASKIE